MNLSSIPPFNHYLAKITNSGNTRMQSDHRIPKKERNKPRTGAEQIRRQAPNRFPLERITEVHGS